MSDKYMIEIKGAPHAAAIARVLQKTLKTAPTWAETGPPQPNAEATFSHSGDHWTVWLHVTPDAQDCEAAHWISIGYRYDLPKEHHRMRCTALIDRIFDDLRDNTPWGLWADHEYPEIYLDRYRPEHGTEQPRGSQPPDSWQVPLPSGGRRSSEIN